MSSMEKNHNQEQGEAVRPLVETVQEADQTTAVQLEVFSRDVESFAAEEVARAEKAIGSAIEGLDSQAAAEGRRIIDTIRERTTAIAAQYRRKAAILLLALASAGAAQAGPATKTKDASAKQPAMAAAPRMDTLDADHGHLEYYEIDSSDIVSIGEGQTLNRDAVGDYQKMLAAAAKDGIRLFPKSGFRSFEVQQQNFYGKMKARHISADSMSRAVAPPGHSEHATGDAVDFNSLEQTFDGTKEFKWMQDHAAEYNFELSFPKNNPQGVMYEPWHWRWVGTAEAKHDLYRDKPYAVRETVDPKRDGQVYVRDLSGKKPGGKGPGLAAH